MICSTPAMKWGKEVNWVHWLYTADSGAATSTDPVTDAITSALSTCGGRVLPRSAAGPFAGGLLEQSCTLTVNHCLDHGEDGPLDGGGQQNLLEGILGF